MKLTWMGTAALLFEEAEHVIAFDPSSAKYVALGEEVAQAFKEGLKLK